MNEDELINLSDEIIEALTQLCLGKTPGFLSNSIFKKLASHPNFSQIKICYSEFINSFDGSYNDATELKKLTDFRYKIVELFQST